MARLSRLTIPGHPHHVFQRGNNRQAVFFTPADREFFLKVLADAAVQFDLAIHAYVLMDNHFHLLATPKSEGALSRTMQALGRRYVRYFNALQQRSGTLWEGRYRSAPIQAAHYLLPCMVYFDLNPIRAGLVAQPQDYAWSSHGHYAGLRADRLLTPHALIWQLGNTPFARESHYRELVHRGITSDQQVALTESALTGWTLGDPDFLTDLQRSTDRRLGRLSPGRPRQPSK